MPEPGKSPITDDGLTGEGRPHQIVVRISGPFSVTAIVCSKWAASEPSLVTTVQPSG
jgi:hypothetical protein